MFFGKKLAQSKDFDKKLKNAVNLVRQKNHNEKQCNHCSEYNSQKGRCNKYMIWVEGNEYEYCGNIKWKIR